jgi:D-alanyl-D-alanine carboxypeptidase (penicillin-binding protein 5/6)
VGSRGRLTVRLAGAALAASAALTAAVPATAATAATAASTASSAGPVGVGARSAAVENAATGRLLWSRGLNTERPMASITKVMTALVVLRAGHLDRAITIPAAVTGYVRAHNASNAGLHPGDRLDAGSPDRAPAEIVTGLRARSRFILTGPGA